MNCPILVSIVLLLISLGTGDCGNISELCHDDKPIDAALSYGFSSRIPVTTILVKKNQVWRFTGAYNGPDSITGPLLLNDFFERAPELESIDAMFHINADRSLKIKDNNYQRMCWLAFVFSRRKYYIFMANVTRDNIVYSYVRHTSKEGVPSGLSPNSGDIQSFTNEKVESIDSALYNIDKKEVIVTVGTNAYIFHQFTDFGKSSGKISKKSISEVFGVKQKKVLASMDDIGNETWILLDKNYCEINLNAPSCKLKPFREWLKCDKSGKGGGGPNKNPPGKKPDRASNDDHSTIIIFVILFVIIFGLIGASLVLFFVLKGMKDSQSNTVQSMATGRPTGQLNGRSTSNVVNRSGVSTVNPQSTTFSTAFAPKNARKK